MPRKPTGRPEADQPGTGQLDNPERITVSLPGEMAARLERIARAANSLPACVSCSNMR